MLLALKRLFLFHSSLVDTMNKTKSRQMKYKRLLVINDHGIFGGGTENRIRTLLIKFLETSFFEDIHVLQKYSSDAQELSTLPDPIKARLFIHTITRNCFFQTRELIQKHSIDIVQCHNLMAIGLLPILSARIKKIPIVFYAHDYWPICGYRSFMNPHSFEKPQLCKNDHSFGQPHCISLKAQVKYLFWKKVINLCTRGIATGKNMIEVYETNSVLRKKWQIITPWINPVFFEQNSEENTRSKLKHNTIPYSILFVGSLLPFKGAFVALQAMKLIVAKFPRAQLLLVGSEQEHDSPYRQELENIARHDNTLKNTQFLGKKTPEELRLLHRSVSVFVFPTICMESFGQSWVEAMAAGCPVIVSDISTLPEYINHRETGLLIRPNDPRALAEAVISIFQNNDFARTIAKNGATYAKTHFSLESAYPQICKIYSEL